MDKIKSNAKNIEFFFFIFIFVSISYLLYSLIYPFIGPMIFGGILAGSFYKVNKKFKGSSSIKALKSSLICTVLILIPSIFIMIQLSKETLHLYEVVKTMVETDRVQKIFESNNMIILFIKKILSSFDLDLSWPLIKETILEASQKFSGTIISSVNKLIGNTFSFLFDFTIAIMVMFTLLSQGSQLKSFVFKLSPLSEEDEQLLLDRFNQMNYVSLVCNGVGGLIQGLLAGIIFLTLGVPSSFLWTVFMIILAFIPLLGISVITIPAGIYLMIQKSTLTGIILIVLTSIIALWVENWFKPKFIGERIKINSIFVLFTIMGGLSVYGVKGVFYGPIIGIMFLTIASIYQEKYSK